MNQVTRTHDDAGRICALFAVDVADFCRPGRNDEVLIYVHTALHQILRYAFEGAGMPWQACVHEDRGDGVLVVVPPTLPAASLIDPLPERLLRLLRRHNRLSCDAAAIQLRAALHIGMVYRDGHGFVGDAVNQLFRLLDAPSLKHALSEFGSELAFITSDYVYRTLIHGQPALADPELFTPLQVQLKESRSVGWVRLSGAAALGPVAQKGEESILRPALSKT